MTTWADFRIDIRLSLKDNGPTPKWSDDELLLYMEEALLDFGLQLPQRAQYSIALVNGTHTYTIADEVVTLQAVEWVEKKKTLLPLEIEPGLTLVEDKYREGYVLTGTSLRLYPTPDAADTLILYAHSLYTAPALDSDPVPVPKVAELALKYFIRAQAVEREELSDANLSRWARAGEKGLDRRDNPLTPLSRALRARYLEQMGILRQFEHIRLVNS